MNINENKLKNIIKDVVISVLNEAEIAKGAMLKLDGPERVIRKILAQRYGVNPEDFEYDGYRTYTYKPKRRASKPKEKKFLGRGEGETHEDYANRVRQLNQKFADAENEIEGEEWRPLSNTGRYFGGTTDYTKSHEISNMGRIRTIDYKDPMRSKISIGYDAPTRSARQFHLDTLDDNGNSLKTTPPIHTMVADAWLDKPEGNIEDYDVIHKDGDYHNNKSDNLEYRLKKGNRGKNNTMQEHKMRNNRTMRVTETKLRNIIRESINEAFSNMANGFSDDPGRRYQMKYENAINTIEYYLYQVNDHHRLSAKQREQLEDVLDFLRETDANDNMEKKEWIEIGKDILSDCAILDLKHGPTD